MGLIKKSFFILKSYGWKIFLKKLFYYPYNRSFLFWQKIKEKQAQRNIKLILRNLKDYNPTKVEEVFDFVWNFYGGLIRPMQIKEEFIELLKILKKLNPKYILEIGTAKGGSLFSFCKIAREDATIISIDLPEGLFGGGYMDWRESLYQAFRKEKQKLYLFREDSHKQEVLEKVKQILNSNRLDFLFIDGDHTYEGVKKDFEMYSSLVRKGGIIAFHDIAPNGYEEYSGGVKYFWVDIKKYYNSQEIIKNINQEGWGIGVIFFK